MAELRDLYDINSNKKNIHVLMIDESEYNDDKIETLQIANVENLRCNGAVKKEEITVHKHTTIVNIP